MKHRSNAFVVLVLFYCTAIWAQSPVSSEKSLLPPSLVESRSFQSLDMQKIAEEDAFSEAMGHPPRFAIVHESGITPEQAGTWEQVGDMSVWRYRVLSKQAVSFNFGFSRFWLPEGAALFIASADGKQVAGPYTAAKNATHGQLWTPIIASADVIIELNVPTAVRGQVELELGTINQGYRAFGAIPAADYEQPSMNIGGEGKACKNEGGVRSGACNTDVMCLSDDDPWNEPRRSVGGVSSGGSVYCTGSLVNNTANDKRMLFTTATHCGVTPGTAASLVVYWNYEWPTCRRPGAAGGTAVNPPDPGMTSSGATFLAATDNPFFGNCAIPGNCSDVTLVELDDPPNPAWNLYWAGWDRNPIGAACSNPADPASTDNLCASIHHPNGDEKRITFVDQDFITANIAGAQGVHWLARWDQTPTQLPNFPAGGVLPPSVTEPGSSGSPLYTADKRFVGVLSGGASFCGAAPGQLTDQYGKLAHAWDGLGTPTTRVRDYLDPGNTNPMTIDGRGGTPFDVVVDPTALEVCGTQGSVMVDINISTSVGFGDPVDLSISGEPAGTSAVFSVTPVIPPGTSELTISSLGAAVSGNYNVVVTGTSGAETTVAVIPMSLSEDALGGTNLTMPADGSGGEPANPVLIWDVNGDAIDYLVEVASDMAFADIVFADVVSDTSVVVDPPLTDATYYWRVTARNYCGDGAVSVIFSFTTIGDDQIFADGFEKPVNPDIVFSGPIDHSFAETVDGTSINWMTGNIIEDDPNSGYDINMYNNGGSIMWWSFSPTISAGVAASVSSSNYLIMQSGDTIGPASTFSRTDGAMTAWRNGAVGYLGFRFNCAALPEPPANDTCYGYLHLQTTGPSGYPATILDWAYNRAGDPIAIP